MKKKNYQAPEVELMECKVERGYSASSSEPTQLENLEMGQEQSALFN